MPFIHFIRNGVLRIIVKSQMLMLKPYEDADIDNIERFARENGIKKVEIEGDDPGIEIGDDAFLVSKGYEKTGTSLAGRSVFSKKLK